MTIRKERLARGWSIHELYRRTGIAAGHLSRIENGKRPPTEGVAVGLDAVFPERRGRLLPKLLATYALPVGLLLLHVSVAAQMLDFMPSVANEHFLDQIEYVYLGLYFLAAAIIFLRSYLRAPSGVLRQQLKWITGGTLA